MSLRELRQPRHRECQTKGKQKVKEREKESHNPPQVPANYVSLRQLQELRLKEEKERDEENKSHKRPIPPPNYVSLRQLQEQCQSEEGKLKERERGKTEEMEGAVGGNCSLVPPNYVSLRQLRELRLKEKENKEAEEAAAKTSLQQVKEQEESETIEVKIHKKTGKMARNPQFNKSCYIGCMKSSLVWQPVLPSASTSIGTGAASADVVLVPENASASCEVLVICDQKGDATAPEINEVVKISDVTEAKTASRNENDKVRKGKTVNLTESRSQSIPARGEVKALNEGQPVGFKIHNGRARRGKGKGKEVNPTEPSHIVAPVSDVSKGSAGVEEVIRFKITNGKEKDKGEKANNPELNDRTPISEDIKRFHSADEVIGSDIQRGKKEIGRGKNGNRPEPSKLTSPVGGYWRKPAARIRDRAHSRAGGADLVWVPKKT